MTRDEIRQIIFDNLKQADNDADIRVQPDPFGGWRIAVVSKSFMDRPLAERKALALQGLEQIPIEWLDLLVPEEREWAGTLPEDMDLQNLPLWPEALARGDQIKPDVTFASDLDEDLPRPLVVSFFSLRGGVGRSTALAYTARLLAEKGHKIVCVDMDLEAPGLAALFGCEAEIREHQGVVELLVQYDRGEEPDITKHLIRLLEEEDLYCLPAGRPDANYARLLRFIDPDSWYREERNPLRELLKGLETRLPFKPDVILLDARTGINPLNAPLIFDLADLAIVVFFPHPQAVTGTRALVRALLAAKTQREVSGHRLTPDLRFLVSPIPSKAKEVVQRYQDRALEWIADWLAPLNAQRAQAPILEEEITHFVPYRETLASSDQILFDKDIWRDFEPVLEWIERFLPTRADETIPTSLAGQKSHILAELRFAAGTAEQQDDFLETFVETEIFKKAMDPSIPLVLGRKGTGKTAILRYLAEGSEAQAIVVQAPSHFRRKYPWLLGPEGFRNIAEILSKRKLGWAQFWAFYTHLAIQKNISDQYSTASVGSESAVVDAFEETLQIPRFGLKLNDDLSKLNNSLLDGLHYLLFDGLDTGFGNNEEDRQRRGEAIAGLFEFWMDREATLNCLNFKILLREDIWRKLRFENKSHLFGRSVPLTWKEQSSFFKVVLKQAVRAEKFRELLVEKFREPRHATLSGSLRDRPTSIIRLMLTLGEDIPMEDWGQDEVFAAWNLLVGERMKGGKTAFTRNWVWNRLADGNEDHSPRYLLQLFHTVTNWEKKEHTRSSYEKSIIRPRALMECLPTVSRQALDALKEEFVELEPLLDRLRELGRTPISAGDLSEFDKPVQLAREVGLLAIYEGTEDSVERYKVPEIYRHALGMTRKGQR
ncbi:MAG: AAA family ATPase [Candidatus Competibacteraceae bacterium]